MTDYTPPKVEKVSSSRYSLLLTHNHICKQLNTNISPCIYVFYNYSSLPTFNTQRMNE